MTLKSLRIAAEFGVLAAVTYVTFVIVSAPFRWARKKWKEMK